jgi:hypothetical protein
MKLPSFPATRVEESREKQGCRLRYSRARSCRGPRIRNAKFYYIFKNVSRWTYSTEKRHFVDQAFQPDAIAHATPTVSNPHFSQRLIENGRSFVLKLKKQTTGDNRDTHIFGCITRKS